MAGTGKGAFRSGKPLLSNLLGLGSSVLRSFDVTQIIQRGFGFAGPLQQRNAARDDYENRVGYGRDLSIQRKGRTGDEIHHPLRHLRIDFFKIADDRTARTHMIADCFGSIDICRLQYDNLGAVSRFDIDNAILAHTERILTTVRRRIRRLVFVSDILLRLELFVVDVVLLVAADLIHDIFQKPCHAVTPDSLLPLVIRYADYRCSTRGIQRPLARRKWDVTGRKQRTWNDRRL